MLTLGVEIATLLSQAMRKLTRKHPKASLWISSLLATAIAGLALFSTIKIIRPVFYDFRVFFASSETNRLVVLMSAATLGFTVLSFRYLDQSRGARASTRRLRNEQEAMRKLLAQLSSKNRTSPIAYEEMRFRLLSDADFVLQFAESASLQESLTEGVSRALDAKGLDNLKRSTTLAAIEQIFESADRRLREEIDSLNRRGTFNLLIGSVTTVGALAVLVLMFLYLPEAGHGEVRGALVYFVPRLSTTIFIEVFAFFFLRLYKSSLDEIKNYQVQLTELARQRVAVLTMISMPNDETKLAVLTALCKKADAVLPSEPAKAVSSENIKQVLDILQQVTKGAVKGKE